MNASRRFLKASLSSGIKKEVVSCSETVLSIAVNDAAIWLKLLMERQ